MIPDKQFLRTSEVAVLLGCSKQYVGKLIQAGKLQSHQLGQHGWHRVAISSLLQYAAAERIMLDFSFLKLDDSTSS